MSTTTLREAVRAAGTEPGDAIADILSSLDSDAARQEFLRGLSERILELENGGDSDAREVAKFEVSRWVGGWFLSAMLSHDAHFVAADREATLLLSVNKIGAGVTGADLRARYTRKR